MLRPFHSLHDPILGLYLLEMIVKGWHGRDVTFPLRKRRIKGRKGPVSPYSVTTAAHPISFLLAAVGDLIFLPRFHAYLWSTAGRESERGGRYEHAIGYRKEDVRKGQLHARLSLYSCPALTSFLLFSAC